MHRPDLGVDCNVLFAYWIGQARAGRMPWLKYLIWQGHIYDVRYGWKQQGSSGHFDHIHLSTRTDHQHTGLDSWSLTPQPEDEMPKLARIDDGPFGPGAIYKSDGVTRARIGTMDEVHAWGQFWGVPASGYPVISWANADWLLGQDISSLSGPPGPAGPAGPAILVPHTHTNAATGPANASGGMAQVRADA
jgi:hypothetical protein